MKIIKMSLMPQHPSKCQCCGVAHNPEHPHDAQSLHYAFWFQEKYGRSPTWADAMAHCPKDVKENFTTNLVKVGVDINSINLTGDIKSKSDLEYRLNPKKVIERLNSLI